MSWARTSLLRTVNVGAQNHLCDRSGHRRIPHMGPYIFVHESIQLPVLRLFGIISRYFCLQPQLIFGNAAGSQSCLKTCA
jgi:hypothetical protein